MIGAILLVLIAFAVGLVLPARARLPFWVAMTARLGVSVANVALKGRMIGASADAQYFFSEAVYQSRDLAALPWEPRILLYGSQAFINAQAIVQALLGGPDFFLSHAVSLLGAAGCLWLLVRIWILLVPSLTGVGWLLLLYSLSPSVLTYQSYVLREVWQSLTVLGIAWVGLSARARGWTPARILALLCLTFVGGVLHKALSVVMPVLALASIALATWVAPLGWIRRPWRLVQLVMVALVIGGVTLPLLSQSRSFDLLREGSLVSEVDSYTVTAETNSRAEYGKLFYASRPWTIVPTFVAYQVTPVPGQIANLADLILAVENLIRFVLLWFFWRHRNRLGPLQRDTVVFFMLMWLAMELTWSVGTINWGTAARHHVPAYGLLVVSGLLGWLARPGRRPARPAVIRRTHPRSRPNRLLRHEHRA